MHKFLVLILFMFTLVSCSSIIKGTSQVITITSSPSGASVSVDGSPMGRTPLSLSLKKNAYSAITISKDGFSTQ
ncbi:MAG: PEGA domain-containing protein, partial [Bdellovibrionaceae bacterium]|nr:PEGA domain-containing protein [Pseudobdellovibrionaceae bacterium]